MVHSLPFLCPVGIQVGECLSTPCLSYKGTKWDEMFNNKQPINHVPQSSTSSQCPQTQELYLDAEMVTQNDATFYE